MDQPGINEDDGALIDVLTVGDAALEKAIDDDNDEKCQILTQRPRGHLLKDEEFRPYLDRPVESFALDGSRPPWEQIAVPGNNIGLPVYQLLKCLYTRTLMEWWTSPDRREPTAIDKQRLEQCLCSNPAEIGKEASIWFLENLHVTQCCLWGAFFMQLIMQRGVLINGEPQVPDTRRGLVADVDITSQYFATEIQTARQTYPAFFAAHPWILSQDDALSLMFSIMCGEPDLPTGEERRALVMCKREVAEILHQRMQLCANVQRQARQMGIPCNWIQHEPLSIPECMRYISRCRLSMIPVQLRTQQDGTIVGPPFQSIDDVIFIAKARRQAQQQSRFRRYVAVQPSTSTVPRKNLEDSAVESQDTRSSSPLPCSSGIAAASTPPSRTMVPPASAAPNVVTFPFSSIHSSVNPVEQTVPVSPTPPTSVSIPSSSDGSVSSHMSDLVTRKRIRVESSSTDDHEDGTTLREKTEKALTHIESDDSTAVDSPRDTTCSMEVDVHSDSLGSALNPIPYPTSPSPSESTDLVSHGTPSEITTSFTAFSAISTSSIFPIIIDAFESEDNENTGHIVVPRSDSHSSDDLINCSTVRHWEDLENPMDCSSTTSFVTSLAADQLETLSDAPRSEIGVEKEEEVTAIAASSKVSQEEDSPSSRIDPKDTLSHSTSPTIPSPSSFERFPPIAKMIPNETVSSSLACSRASSPGTVSGILDDHSRSEQIDKIELIVDSSKTEPIASGSKTVAKPAESTADVPHLECTRCIYTFLSFGTLMRHFRKHSPPGGIATLFAHNRDKVTLKQTLKAIKLSKAERILLKETMEKTTIPLFLRKEGVRWTPGTDINRVSTKVANNVQSERQEKKKETRPRRNAAVISDLLNKDLLSSSPVPPLNTVSTSAQHSLLNPAASSSTVALPMNDEDRPNSVEL